MLSSMPRIALIAAFLATGWSPAAHCLATASGAEATASCHTGATSKPAKAPMADCAAMVCCQTVLLSPAIVAPESSVPAPVAVATLILVPPAPPAEFAPAAPPGPPGVLLAVSLLGRAPPVA